MCTPSSISWKVSGVCRYSAGTLKSVRGLQVLCRYPEKCQGFAEIDRLWTSRSPGCIIRRFSVCPKGKPILSLNLIYSTPDTKRMIVLQNTKLCLNCMGIEPEFPGPRPICYPLTYHLTRGMTAFFPLNTQHSTVHLVAYPFFTLTT